tara:strand:+ start:5233 stop:5478 length:246 start_codon:yes stop_codon:yes gene_type:complete
MSYIKVKDFSNLARDPESGQIVNTNDFEYDQYIARRTAKKLEKQKQVEVEGDLDTMKSDLDNLKGEIGEIKSLLKELVNGH